MVSVYFYYAASLQHEKIYKSFHSVNPQGITGITSQTVAVGSLTHGTLDMKWIVETS